MFRPIEGLAARRLVTLQVEGRDIVAPEGQSLALALLQAGVDAFRETPVLAAPRGPLCLMGVCFDCLVQIDGRPNVQACMVPVCDGMIVQLQRGARRAEPAA
jgi:predicted molibdopterin-dependent oxidoreductase YjgC